MLRRHNQTDSLPDEGRKGRRADMHEADIASAGSLSGLVSK